MPERKTVAAKPAIDVKVTSVEPKPTDAAIQTAVQESAKNDVSQTTEPIAQTGKNNLLPTIFVLSIVIGCVAIVTAGKKIK